jgi:hypothetical protein
MRRIFRYIALILLLQPLQALGQAVAQGSYICASTVGGGLALEGYDYTLAHFNLSNLSFLLVPWTEAMKQPLASATRELQIAEPSYLVQEVGVDKPIAICQGQGVRVACRHFAGGVSYWNLESLKFEILMPSHYTQPEDQGTQVGGAIQGRCEPLPD